MLVVGLTGGIGAGKSAVSAMLVERGALLIDADAIVHELQRPGTEVFEAIVHRFGPAVVGDDGALDRPALADLVFGADDAARAALADLNAIVHPAVGDEIAARLVEASTTDHVVVLDVPLMVESGRGGHAGLLVVDCPEELAIERLTQQRGMDPDEARARMARQASRDDRLAKADFVIDNSGDRDHLRSEVDRAWEWITGLRDG